MTKALSAFNSFDDFFNCLSIFFNAHGDMASELVTARMDFFKLTGKLNESDASFTNRMNAFLLWFTFDWRCAQTLKTPFEMFKEDFLQTDVTNTKVAFIGDVENHIHSLFETVKLTNNHAILKDLYSKKKYEIQQPDILLGSNKGIYFETRIFKLGGGYQFSNYLIQHPAEVKKDVTKRCKILFKKGDAIKPFLILLHMYHTKWERYRNINIKSIYHFDSSIPEAK